VTHSDPLALNSPSPPHAARSCTSECLAQWRTHTVCCKHLLCVHTLTRRFAVYTILEELSRACRAVTCVPQQTQVWISRTVYHYLDPAGSTCFGHHMSMCGICQIGQQQSHHPSGPLKAMHALPWSIFMTTVPTAAGMHLFVRLQQIHSKKR
jgi:hypothetical protein